MKRIVFLIGGLALTGLLAAPPVQAADQADGQRQRPRQRDGEQQRQGPRDGEGERQGPRDGEGQRQGPRDGERPRHGPDDRQARMEQVLQQLNLSDDQKQQIKQIHDDVRSKLEGLREQLKDLPPEQRRERIREAIGDVRGRISAVLTEEQRQQLREKLEAGRGDNPRGRDGRRDGPDDDQGPQADDEPRGRGAMFARIQENLSKLDLSAEQKTKIDAILAEAADKLAKLREQSDLKDLHEQAGAVFRETREKVGEVLTPEQRQKLAELMPGRGPRGGPPGDARPNDGPPGDDDRPRRKPDEPRAQSDTPTTNPNSTAAKAAVAFSPNNRNNDDTNPFAPGTPAPAFRLKTSAGKTVSLTDYRGKPTVLLFGSFSSPTFRDRLPQFELLRKGFRNKVNVVVIYTREAYPANEWHLQRNEDEQVRVNQHLDYAERLRLAKQVREAAGVDMDVLVDDIDDAVARAYDGVPNAAVLIDAQGAIIARQQWADPHGAKAWLDEALQSR